jgi:hypothetical protein
VRSCRNWACMPHIRMEEEDSTHTSPTYQVGHMSHVCQMKSCVTTNTVAHAKCHVHVMPVQPSSPPLLPCSPGGGSGVSRSARYDTVP